MANRLNFTRETKIKICKESGFFCNNPFCRRFLWHPDKAGNYIGIVGHIIAASANGPRAHPEFDKHKRYIRSAENGILLCQSCEFMIDHDPSKYTITLLGKWKADAQIFYQSYINKYPIKKLDVEDDYDEIFTSWTKKYEKNHLDLIDKLELLNKRRLEAYQKAKISIPKEQLEDALQQIEVLKNEKETLQQKYNVENQKLKEENQKLKEENQKLTKQFDQYHDELQKVLDRRKEELLQMKEQELTQLKNKNETDMKIKDAYIHNLVTHLTKLSSSI